MHLPSVVLIGVVLMEPDKSRWFRRVYNKYEHLNMSYCMYNRRKLQQKWEKYPNIWVCNYEN